MNNRLLQSINASNAVVDECYEERGGALFAAFGWKGLRGHIQDLKCPEEMKRAYTLGVLQYLVRNNLLEDILAGFNDPKYYESDIGPKSDKFYESQLRKAEEINYWREVYLYYLIANAKQVHAWQWDQIIGQPVLEQANSHVKHGKDVSPKANALYKAKYNEDIKLTYADFISGVREEAIPEEGEDIAPARRRKLIAQAHTRRLNISKALCEIKRPEVLEKIQPEVSEYLYKQFVLSIKKLIETLPWLVDKTFGLGGKKITFTADNGMRETKTIPGNAHKWYQACLAAEADEKAGQCDWHHYFNQIATAAEKAKPAPFTLFGMGKRDEATQFCYDKVDEMTKSLRSKL